MKRVVVTLIAVIWTFGFQYAQDINKDTAAAKKFIYHYNLKPEDLSSINKQMLGEHPFGDLIARKIYLLQDLYTYTEKPTPTSPGEKTIVLKPYVYNTILKLNRMLKKQVKKGIIPKDTASKDLDHCLDIALSILGDDTSAFEMELRKAKDADQIIQVFNMVELRY